MLKKLFLIVFIVISTSSAFAQLSTVYFYRLKSLFLSNTEIAIAINDTSKISLTNGSYKPLNTHATQLNMITSINNNGLKNLTLEKGKTYYIEVEVLSPTTISLTPRSEFTAKPALERLETDAKSKTINTSNLKSVKVISVAPIPQPTEDKATIYLFRPFNVSGVNLNIKISDESNLYEMKNKSSYVITTDKSEINFTSVNEGNNTSNTSLKLKLEKGKAYYVAVLRTGGAIVLSETKEQYAKNEMKLQ
jgi:hypothetical protein